MANRLKTIETRVKGQSSVSFGGGGGSFRRQSGRAGKVIHPKYSKHWPYLLASKMNCGCSKTLIHGLNHGLFQVLWVKYIQN